jgi:hypothetical protein
MRIDRGPVVDVLAGQAVGELVGMGLAEEVGAGVEEPLDRFRGRRLVGAQPVGLAEAGPGTRDVEQVLGAEGQAGERAATGALESDMVVAAERPERVVGRDPGHGRRHQA